MGKLKSKKLDMLQPDLSKPTPVVESFKTSKMSAGKKGTGGPKINMIGPDLSGGGWVEGKGK
jgi:hypothetical protein